MQNTDENISITPARIVNRFLFWCGFAFFLLLPYHQVLRTFTGTPLIIAWKEMLQVVGLILLIISIGISRAAGMWNRLVILWALLTAMCLPSVRATFIVQSIDTMLLLIGPSCAGFYFYSEIRQFYETGTITRSMKVLFLAAILISLWIILGGRLGLDRFVSHEDPEWAFLREGVVRVTGPFDAPMSAGQYIWFLGTVSMGAAMFVKGLWNIGLLYAISALCYIAVLYTASRGPYIIVGCSGLILLIAGLWVRSPDFGKKAGIIITTAVVGIIVVACIIDAETLETYLRIFNSSLSSNESSNAERNTRMAEGLRAAIKYFPLGRGLEWYPVRSLVGTGLIYENTYLGLSVALGLRGVIIGLVYALGLSLGILVALVNVFRRRAPAALMAALLVPWAAYSMMYPQLQGRFASMVSWSVFGASLACFVCLRQWNKEV